MINKKIASELAVGIVLLIAIAMGGIFWMENRNPVISDQSSNINSEIQKPTEKTSVGGGGNVAMANPASAFCLDHGGKLETQGDIGSAQSSYCVLEDGTKCEEWQYFRGECSIAEKLADWNGVQFDSCGGKEKYENLSWWNDFVKQMEQLNYYSDAYISSTLRSANNNEYFNKDHEVYTYESYCADENYINSVICGSGKTKKLKIDDFNQYSQGCLAKDGSKFVAVVAGEYMGGGNYVFRYDIEKDKLEQARKVDQGGKADFWSNPPTSFKKRIGNIIKMTGATGDAGCGAIANFDFNIAENYIKITKECVSCNGEKETCETY